MRNQSDTQESNWSRLLGKAYGDVEVDSAFQAGLLRILKAKLPVAPAADDVHQADADADKWGRLLSTAYPPCQPRPAFKNSLLATLKVKQADSVAQMESAAEERHWQRLLSAAYPSCQPDMTFKASLLASLKAKQVEAAGRELVTREDEIMRTILTSNYTPVSPRKEFETRLLENLKERQRHTQSIKLASRRRTWFMSGVSGLAAAAMVMFMMWVMPAKDLFAPKSNSVGNSSIHALASFPSALASERTMPAAPSTLAWANAVMDDDDVTSSNEVASASMAVSYRLADAFDSNPLPATVRGVGMEVNDGDGWRPMDDTLLANVETGMAFRPIPNFERAGLGFGDGTAIHVLPNSVVQVAENGLRLREGFISVKVPASADHRFRLDFPEREVAVEPGTMLFASAESPDRYADGGAPAPVVILDDGGFAIARGKNGSGPLFASQMYQIDRYVTPELPGRPMCAMEYANLEERMAPAGVALAPRSGGVQMVSAPVAGTGRLSYSPAGFEKRGSRWVANGYAGQPTLKIKYLSDEYFGLANQRRDLAYVLSLGSELIFDGGDGIYYEISK